MLYEIYERIGTNLLKNTNRIGRIFLIESSVFAYVVKSGIRIYFSSTYSAMHTRSHV